MADGGAVAVSGKPAAQLFGDVNRTVPAAGAADGDGEVALSLGAVARQQRREEIREAPEKIRIALIALDIGADLGVLAGLVAQRIEVVRVAEEAHVEHEVGRARNALPVGERHHDHRHRRRAREAERGAQLAAQIAFGQVGGVDHPVRAVAQLREALALHGDAVGHRAVERERVAPARLRIPAQQRLVGAIEEQDEEIEVVAGAQRVDRGEERRRAEIARADVDADGQRAVARRAGLHQRRNQRRGQVVDGLVAHVLERVERGRAAGAGQPGDQQHARAAGIGVGNGGGVGFGHGRRGGSRPDMARRPGQGKPQLGRRRVFERRDFDARNGNAQDRFRRRVGQPLGGAARDEIGDQRHRRFRQRRRRHDAHAAHLHLPRDGRRRTRDQASALRREFHLVVGDEPRPRVDQAQREVGFARARGAAQQDGRPAEGDAGGMHAEDGHRAQRSGDRRRRRQ